MAAPKNHTPDPVSSTRALDRAVAPNAEGLDPYLEGVIVKLQEQEKPITLKLMGAQDQVNLNPPESALKSARESISVYQMRRELLLDAIRALRALQRHLNYPALPRFRLSQEDYDFFQQQPLAMVSANEQYDVEDPPATQMATDFKITDQP